jgi:hypothetical protein
MNVSLDNPLSIRAPFGDRRVFPLLGLPHNAHSFVIANSRTGLISSIVNLTDMLFSVTNFLIQEFLWVVQTQSICGNR